MTSSTAAREVEDGVAAFPIDQNEFKYLRDSIQLTKDAVDLAQTQYGDGIGAPVEIR